MRIESAPGTTAHQASIIDAALARCTYPFADCDPDRTVLVEWVDLSRFRQIPSVSAGSKTTYLEHGYGLQTRIAGTATSHHHDAADPNAADPIEWRSRVLGLAYYLGKIAIDTSLEDDPEFAGEVFLSELAHMIDFFCMTDEDRIEIWNALHPGVELDLSHLLDVEDEVDLGHGHSWFDVGDYYSWVGEAWMGLFVRAWSDFDVTIDFPDHPPTPEAIQQVRRWFTPEQTVPETPVVPEPTTPDPGLPETTEPQGCLDELLEPYRAIPRTLRRWFGR